MGYQVVNSLDVRRSSVLSLCLNIAELYHKRFGEFDGDRFSADCNGIMIYSMVDNSRATYTWHSLGLRFTKWGDLDYLEGFAEEVAAI